MVHSVLSRLGACERRRRLVLGKKGVRQGTPLAGPVETRGHRKVLAGLVRGADVVRMVAKWGGVADWTVYNVAMQRCGELRSGAGLMQVYGMARRNGADVGPEGESIFLTGLRRCGMSRLAAEYWPQLAHRTAFAASAAIAAANEAGNLAFGLAVALEWLRGAGRPPLRGKTDAAASVFIGGGRAPPPAPASSAAVFSGGHAPLSAPASTQSSQHTTIDLFPGQTSGQRGKEERLAAGQTLRSRDVDKTDGASKTPQSGTGSPVIPGKELEQGEEEAAGRSMQQARLEEREKARLQRAEGMRSTPTDALEVQSVVTPLAALLLSHGRHTALWSHVMPAVAVTPALLSALLEACLGKGSAPWQRQSFRVWTRLAGRAAAQLSVVHYTLRMRIVLATPRPSSGVELLYADLLRTGRRQNTGHRLAPDARLFLVRAQAAWLQTRNLLSEGSSPPRTAAAVLRLRARAVRVLSAVACGATSLRATACEVSQCRAALSSLGTLPEDPHAWPAHPGFDRVTALLFGPSGPPCAAARNDGPGPASNRHHEPSLGQPLAGVHVGDAPHPFGPSGPPCAAAGSDGPGPEPASNRLHVPSSRILTGAPASGAPLLPATRRTGTDPPASSRRSEHLAVVPANGEPSSTRSSAPRLDRRVATKLRPLPPATCRNRDASPPRDPPASSRRSEDPAVVLANGEPSSTRSSAPRLDRRVATKLRPLPPATCRNRDASPPRDPPASSRRGSEDPAVVLANGEPSSTRSSAPRLDRRVATKLRPLLPATCRNRDASPPRDPPASSRRGSEDPAVVPANGEPSSTRSSAPRRNGRVASKIIPFAPGSGGGSVRPAPLARPRGRRARGAGKSRAAEFAEADWSDLLRLRGTGLLPDRAVAAALLCVLNAGRRRLVAAAVSRLFCPLAGEGWAPGPRSTAAALVFCATVGTAQARRLASLLLRRSKNLGHDPLQVERTYRRLCKPSARAERHRNLTRTSRRASRTSP
ncbi:hypothetical protein DIPPA_02334 [Diplonema papillatum]|nr:hypothetical protein DIPPA_02334 [Diplonema papillatum]